VACHAAGFNLVREPGLHARIDNGRVAKAIARRSLVRTGIEIPARHGEPRDTAPVEAPSSRRPLRQHQLVVLPDAAVAAQRLLPFRIGLGRAASHNRRRIVVNRSRPFHIHRRRRARRRVRLPAVYEIVWRKLLHRRAASIVEGIGARRIRSRRAGIVETRRVVARNGRFPVGRIGDMLEARPDPGRAFRSFLHDVQADQSCDVLFAFLRKRIEEPGQAAMKALRMGNACGLVRFSQIDPG
jgi:hypothetical protein